MKITQDEMLPIRFLHGLSPDLEFFADGDALFSDVKILPDVRLALPGQWGLGVENQYHNKFWQIEKTTCLLANALLNRLLNFALTLLDEPASILCEYKHVQTPKTREQLRVLKDPITLCYSGDGGSSDYFLHTLHSLAALTYDVKQDECLLIHSREFVPVIRQQGL